MSLARNIAEQMHDYSVLNKIDIPHHCEKNNDNEIYGFLDCSVLVLQKNNSNKAFVSEPKYITSSFYKKMNIEKSLFRQNKNSLDALLNKKDSHSFNSNALSLEINQDHKIRLGFNKLHILSNGTFIGELSSGKLFKFLHHKDKIFKDVNIDPNLIKKTLCNKLEQDLNLIKLNDDLVLNSQSQSQTKHSIQITKKRKNKFTI